jgi:bifunctional UDP-N-acetylglucosamine pyrophosphorylase/glucosamine-1-phosphate N-acetyltransferase
MTHAATLSGVILAAGHGTRLQSARPKVLHPLAGQSLVSYAVEAMAAALALGSAATGRRPVLVVGPESEAVRAVLGDRVSYVVQPEPLGTADAVRQAEGELKGASAAVLVTYADMPLLRSETLRLLAETQAANSGPLTLLSLHSSQRADFGRVVRNSAAEVQAVIEAVQATPEQRRLTEVNVGAYCFNAEWLWAHLPRLAVSPTGEYYLTDLVEQAVLQGGRVASVTIDDEDEVIGVNNRVQLAEAEAALRRRINRRWMLAGVTLVDPATTYIEPSAELGLDTTLLPNTHICGHSVIGAECVLGPNTMVRDTTVGDRCRVECSVLEGAVLAEDVSVGPFAHLRPGARLERGVHMGNFGEVKNSTLGPGVKMGHFSYVGDATLGAEVNIGAGTITCNFDGIKKNQTVIGAGAFIGSDTLLVAPVTLGAGARTGAGAVVTKDVAPDTLAVGMPARAIRKLK